MTNEGSVAQISAAVRTGQQSAKEIVEAALARIRAANGTLNAFETLLDDRALSDASAVDRAVRAGIDPGPLAGVPFAVKSLFDVKGIPTTAGSRIHGDLPAPTVDGAAVLRLTQAGAVLVGTTTMDEYAHGFTTENSHFGTARNPWDTTRIAGGSSGGSAAAVAAGLVPVALGSDTNGSIRVPSGLCGVFGLKPTFGRFSRPGSVPFVSSLDHVGPIAAELADLTAVYDVLQGHDPDDPASLNVAPQPCGPLLNSGMGGLRIALVDQHFLRVIDSQTAECLEAVREALTVRRRITVRQSDRACAAAHLITAAEGGQRHLTSLQTRPQDFDPKVRVGLSAGVLLPAAHYIAAQRFRRWYRTEVERVLDDVDVLMTATTPSAAPAIGQSHMIVDGEEHLVGMALGLLTQPWSLIGLPALSLPVHRTGGLPIGIQLVAAAGNESALIRTAGALEAAGMVGKISSPAKAP
ncbi:AtzE family amidohydrolase [soil metagenome]